MFEENLVAWYHGEYIRPPKRGVRQADVNRSRFFEYSLDLAVNTVSVNNLAQSRTLSWYLQTS